MSGFLGPDPNVDPKAQLRKKKKALKYLNKSNKKRAKMSFYKNLKGVLCQVDLVVSYSDKE